VPPYGTDTGDAEAIGEFPICVNGAHVGNLIVAKMERKEGE